MNSAEFSTENIQHIKPSRSRLLHRYGGLVQLLDIRSLSSNCGLSCTVDGMHYDGAINEAALQILLNALLIESHQKLGLACSLLFPVWFGIHSFHPSGCYMNVVFVQR
ncbi:hypothetical protein LINGRAHAP2_LOCUS24382 [Linum grandiflorum]